MSNSTTASAFSLPEGTPAAGRAVLRLLHHLRHGQLTLQLPDGSVHRLGDGGGLRAALRLHDWTPCVSALRSGDIGFAESYLDGHWSSPHLSDLLRLLARNRQALDQALYGSWLGRLGYRLRHLLNRNTRRNSRRNIHQHYDLGNDFYRLWLDETMNYSSALFTPEASDLVSAQHRKVDRALAEVELRPGQRLLEIGCGWGALAEAATVRWGADVVGVTLSTEQLAWARERLQRVGASARADLRLQDYRDIGVERPEAPFDAIVSIEMVEAVGREYWPGYFQSVARLLKPGGRACIQSITIDDTLFDRYLRGTDFIQQHIFPGGCLPSPAAFEAEARRAGLEVLHRHAFGVDYAHTLRHWRERFLRHETEVRDLGFDARFMRLWEFYLAYCEAGFEEGNLDVMQFTLRKPGSA